MYYRGMKLIWCTDIHLNFLPFPEKFGEYLGPEGDALVVTGDISEAPYVEEHLKGLADSFGKPVYFVLGNHDYYKGSFDSVNTKMATLEHPNLFWLRGRIVELTPQAALIGHEGWYDGQYGDGWGSRVGFADWTQIKDFLGVAYHRDSLLQFIQKIAYKAAQEADKTLTAALERYEHVYFATHFPPYDKATWHLGQMSDPDWMPWFSSKIMGVVLERAAEDYPDRQITVLCGHTHSPGEYQHRPNLLVLTGESEYRAPKISKVFEL